MGVGGGGGEYKGVFLFLKRFKEKNVNLNRQQRRPI